MPESKTYTGNCSCAAAEISVTGKPLVMGSCYCQSCRSWSAGRVDALTRWPPEAVKISKGAENIGKCQKTDGSVRQWCLTCGGNLLTEHPLGGVTDVYAATIPDFEFEPGLHFNDEETVLPMKDGLPKFKDMPAESGGSGATLPE